MILVAKNGQLCNVICGSLVETLPCFDKERWYAFNP